jgi:hypothetical protein
MRVVAGVGSDDKAALKAVTVPAMSSTIGAKTCPADQVDNRWRRRRCLFRQCRWNDLEQMARLMKCGRLMPIGHERCILGADEPAAQELFHRCGLGCAWAEKFPSRLRVYDTLAQLLAEGKLPHADRVLPEQAKEEMRAWPIGRFRKNRLQDKVAAGGGKKEGSMTSIIIDRRYCGPPNSGNGGYAAAGWPGTFPAARR